MDGGEILCGEEKALSIPPRLHNSQYYLYFSVYSDRARTLALSVGSAFSGIALLSPANITLAPGITPCTVKLLLESGYSMTFRFPDGRTAKRSDRLDGALLRLGPVDLVVKAPLEVLAAAHTLYLPTQEQNLEILKKLWSRQRWKVTRISWPCVWTQSLN